MILVSKIFYLSIIIILFQSCSFDTKSGFWSQEKKIAELEEKNEKTKKLFEKESISNLEFNPNLKLKLSLDKKYRNKTKQNNFGPLKTNINLKKISNYKFKKIQYFDQFEPEIVFYGTDILFFEKDGSIVRFNKEGKIVWKVNHYKKRDKKLQPLIKLTMYNQNILVTDSLSKIYLIKANNGELIWSTEHVVNFISQIKIDENRFYALDANNTLHCFSLTNGRKLWEFKSGEKFINSQKQTSIILDKEKVIFDNSKGEIIALNKFNGNLLWISPTISFDESYQSFLLKTSDIVLDNKDIFFSNNKNDFYSLNSDTGLLNWKQNINSYMRPIIVDNVIFSISSNGYLNIIEKNTGNIIRATNILKNLKERKKKRISFAGFIVTSKQVIISTNQGHLIQVNIENGLTEKIFRVSRNQISKPYENNNNIFVIEDNRIIKLN